MLAFPLMALQETSGLELGGASFRSFYDETLPRIYAYFVHRTGGSRAVAEDLTQETFLAAVAELRRGQRPEAPTAWIHGIARHKLLDHYRRCERAEHLMADAPAREPVADAEPDAARERVAVALNAVPAPQRAVLVLHYLDGFSVREAANLVGKSEKAVESLLTRGRESLKHAYEAVPR